MGKYLSIAKDLSREISELSEIRVAPSKSPDCEISELSEISPPDEASIRAWLAHIGETDPVMIAECLDRCATDPDALAYFLMRSAEVPAPIVDPDKADALACGMTDCRDCLRFRGPERVCAASRCPTPETLFRRCDSFKPRATP